MILYIIIFFLTSLIIFLALANARFSKKLDASERNLRMLEEKKAHNTVDEQQLKDDFSKRMKLFFEEKVDDLVIRKQEPTKTEEYEKMIRKVYGNKKQYKDWEFERIMISIIAFALGSFAFVLLKEIMILGLAIMVAIALYYISGNDLKAKAKNKDWENFVFFPDLLMSLCMLYRVGAVSTIFQGFKRVCKVYDHPLIDEIKLAVKEYEFNKDKYDVLNDLAERVDFKEFTSFVNLIIETEKNNIPIVDTLTEYAFEISAKRKILATNQILKLPEKIDLVMYLTSTPICLIYMVMPSLKMAVEQLLEQGIM